MRFKRQPIRWLNLRLNFDEMDVLLTHLACPKSYITTFPKNLMFCIDFVLIKTLSELNTQLTYFGHGYIL